MGQMFSKRTDSEVESDLDSDGEQIHEEEDEEFQEACDRDFQAPPSFKKDSRQEEPREAKELLIFSTPPSTPMPREMVTIGEDEELGELGEQEHDVIPMHTPNSEGQVDAPAETPRAKVRPLSKSISRPKVPTNLPGDGWLKLSNLDRVVNPTFSSVIHFYKNVITEDNSFIDVVNFLKETLSKVLVEFYPMAGRLTVRDDGVVDLKCDDQGAVFIEAVVDAELKDWGGAQPNYLLSGLEIAKVGAGPIYVPDQLKPMPVTIIQVTMFRCGTIAIGTNWHHTVADGFSGTHFMESWAEVALDKPISLKPDHNREILKPRNPLNPSLVYGYSTKSLEDICPEAAKARTTEPAKLETFHVDKEKVKELKDIANQFPPPFTPRPYTSAESISAHLWIQMTKARAAANAYTAELARDTITKFFMFVDGRKRLRLPAGYFGNVVCSACAVAKEAEIINGQVHYAASLIRTATRNINDEYFRSLIDWVEDKGMSSTKSDHVNSLGHDVAATFWTFFPLYEIEFGWGRPTFAARNSPPRPLIDGIAMMPSADGAGNMVALLNLHADRMSKLQHQTSFATVFQS